MIKERDSLLMEREKTLNELNDKFSSVNFNVEKRRLLDLVCSNCNKSLKISDEDLGEFLNQGTTIKEYVCDNCDMINRLKVVFDDDPSVSQANIVRSERGLKYKTQPAHKLNDEELIRRLEYEGKLIDEGRSKMEPQFQFLIKYLIVLYKKNGLI